MLIAFGGQPIIYGGQEIEYGPISDPSAINIADNSFSISSNSYVNGVCALIVTAAGAAQPSDAAFDASAEHANIVANTAFLIAHTSALSGTPYRAWMQINVGGTRTTTSLLVTTTGLDVTKPTIALAVSNIGSVYTFTATPDDNVGVAGVQFFINGLPGGAEVAVSPWQWIWNTSGQLDGVYNITAQARDSAGNTRFSNTVQVVVANGIQPQQGAPYARRGHGTYEQKNSIWQQIETF